MREQPSTGCSLPAHYTANDLPVLVHTIVDQPIRPAIAMIMNWTQALQK